MVADIAVDMANQGVDPIGEIMVSTWYFPKVDFDVALMGELRDELLHGFNRHHCVLIALQDEAG